MKDARALLMALPNPTIMVGPDSKITVANSAAQKLLGQTEDGWHYITALRQPAVLDAVEAAFAGKGPLTCPFLGNDGARDTTWDVIVTAVMLQDGLSVILSFEDRTAMEDAGAMRRDFVANVSHEMRTPLTSLLGFIETLRGPARGDSAAQERFLGIMEQEAGRMHRLVEDLLSLSRVEGEERIRPTEPVALTSLIPEVIESLAPIAKARKVTLTLKLPDEHVDVPGDRGQLWQVLSNLIENAIKYGREGGEVTIHLGAPSHEPSLRQMGVRLCVCDEGEGIAPHHIARLTERFYRADAHRSREVGGTGLGLAICKHIINRHRGRLRISSVVGQGSEFKVVLPSIT